MDSIQQYLATLQNLSPLTKAENESINKLPMSKIFEFRNFRKEAALVSYFRFPQSQASVMVPNQKSTLIQQKDSSVYYGSANKNIKNGPGILIGSDGSIQEGLYYSGQINGEGRLITHDGSLYEGKWVDGQIVSGIYVSTSQKFVYKGEMHNKNPHGSGIQRYCDGTAYSGSYSNGKWHGHGELNLADGSLYVGEFDRGHKHGKGTIHFMNRDWYEGGWKNNQIDGYGVYKYSNGQEYSGNFSKGLKEGFGTQTNLDGSYSRGYWAKNIYRGDSDSIYGDLFDPLSDQRLVKAGSVELDRLKLSSEHQCLRYSNPLRQTIANKKKPLKAYNKYSKRYSANEVKNRNFSDNIQNSVLSSDQDSENKTSSHSSISNSQGRTDSIVNEAEFIINTNSQNSFNSPPVTIQQDCTGAQRDCAGDQKNCTGAQIAYPYTPLPNIFESNMPSNPLDNTHHHPSNQTPPLPNLAPNQPVYPTPDLNLPQNLPDLNSSKHLLPNYHPNAPQSLPDAISNTNLPSLIPSSYANAPLLVPGPHQNLPSLIPQHNLPPLSSSPKQSLPSLVPNSGLNLPSLVPDTNQNLSNYPQKQPEQPDSSTQDTGSDVRAIDLPILATNSDVLNSQWLSINEILNDMTELQSFDLFTPFKQHLQSYPQYNYSITFYAYSFNFKWTTIKRNTHYKGEFNANGEPEGVGMCISKRHLYQGSWVKGQKEGLGRQFWRNGTVYHGYWSRGKRYGFGLGLDGSMYVGDWEQDDPHGRGYYSNQEVQYNGNWADGTWDGEGIVITKNGEILRGIFKKGEMSNS